MLKRNEHIRRLEILLEKIIKNKNLHIRWLNTLSYLEHTGSKKIHKANLGKYLTERILSHACEEARHAYFFKKSIRKIEPTISNNFNYDYKNLLAGLSSFKYFQLLDLKVYRFINNYFSSLNKEFIAYLCYLYVTYLIEERADMVFAIYQERLNQENIPINLKSVIYEEEKHLKEIYQLIQDNDSSYQKHLFELSNIETNLFDWYLYRLEKMVFPSNEDLGVVDQEDLV
jgi:chemotaxis methyl-accepting protein methylase